MFSRITIELSTSIPTPNANPAKVITFNVKPKKYINNIVMTIEIGIDKVIINTLFKLLKNKNKIMIASIAPNIAVKATWDKESLIIFVLSYITSTDFIS